MLFGLFYFFFRLERKCVKSSNFRHKYTKYLFNYSIIVTNFVLVTLFALISPQKPGFSAPRQKIIYSELSTLNDYFAQAGKISYSSQLIFYFIHYNFILYPRPIIN